MAEIVFRMTLPMLNTQCLVLTLVLGRCLLCLSLYKFQMHLSAIHGDCARSFVDWLHYVVSASHHMYEIHTSSSPSLPALLTYLAQDVLWIVDGYEIHTNRSLKRTWVSGLGLLWTLTYLLSQGLEWRDEWSWAQLPLGIWQCSHKKKMQEMWPWSRLLLNQNQKIGKSWLLHNSRFPTLQGLLWPQALRHPRPVKFPSLQDLRSWNSTLKWQHVL